MQDICNRLENTANSFIMTSIINQKLVTGLLILFFRCYSFFKVQSSLSLPCEQATLQGVGVSEARIFLQYLMCL